MGALVLLVAGLALYFRVGTVRRPPVEVTAPVAGRWTAVNSPADKVPSHGLHAYGQTYATDLVHEPADGSRPAFGDGPGFQPPEDFPAFGQPVLAPPDGMVVRAHGRERDHRLKDHHSVLFAAGLAFRLARFEVGGHAEAGVPANGSRSQWPRRADPAGYRLQWVSPSR